MFSPRIRERYGDHATIPRLFRRDGRAHLFADHQNCERARYGGATSPAASAGWRWRGRSTLITHREDVVRLAVKRYCSRAIHRLQILLNLESRWALLLNDSQRTVAMCAEGFHCCSVEHRADGAPERAHAAKSTRFFASKASPLHPPLSPNG